MGGSRWAPGGNATAGQAARGTSIRFRAELPDARRAYTTPKCLTIARTSRTKISGNPAFFRARLRGWRPDCVIRTIRRETPPVPRRSNACMSTSICARIPVKLYQDGDGPVGRVPEWLKGTGCKPVGICLRWFESSRAQSNPLSSVSTRRPRRVPLCPTSSWRYLSSGRHAGRLRRGS